MLYNNNIDEIRSLCRSKIESFEYWARKLIDDQFSKLYSPDYVNFKLKDGNLLLNKSILNKIILITKSNPERVKRPVDALFLDDLVNILCNQRYYNQCFKKPLQKAYPDGHSVAKTFLSRLISPRNSLSHANPISYREAEQIICYINDFEDSLKSYYFEVNMQHEYNVPRIISFIDSLGQQIHRNQCISTGYGILFIINHTFHQNDQYRIKIEVDAAFDPSTYKIIWESDAENFSINNNEFHTTLTEQCVGINFGIEVSVISNNNWHKFRSHDDCLKLVLKVIPKI